MNGAVSKTVKGLWVLRGFESHPLRCMSAISGLFDGVPVSDLDAGIDWYTRFFGRPPDMRAGDEVLWDLIEHATLFVEPNAAHFRFALLFTSGSLGICGLGLPVPKGRHLRLLLGD